jgi:hypothetical protein
MLTTRRIIYLPAYVRIFPKWFPWRRLDIRLSEVATVSSGSWSRRFLGDVPGVPVLVVHANNGKRYTFQTVHARAWQDEIEKTIGMT